MIILRRAQGQTCVFLPHFLFMVSLMLALGKSAMALTVTGPITASAVSVQGSVTLSSVTISSLTINNLLEVTGKTQGIGSIIQMKFSSTTVTTSLSSTTYQPITDLKCTIAMTNPNNYVRISLTGDLGISSAFFASAYITIKRDLVDLGNTVNDTGLSSSETFAGFGGAWTTSSGITITDSPGDTSIHEYQAYIRTTDSSQPVAFADYAVGYLLVEEIHL